MVFVYVFLIGLTAAVPSLKCGHPDTHICRIRDVELTLEDRRYDVVPSISGEMREVLLLDSTLPYLSPDFCGTFEALESFKAERQGIEVVDQDAFVQCYELRFLDLGGNLIQVIPEDLFRANSKLRTAYLEKNLIGGVPRELFGPTRELFILHLHTNFISSFPPELLRNNSGLFELSVHTNDIHDFDAVKLLSFLPSLKYANIRQNLFPCSRVPGIVSAFKSKGVELENSQNPRERVLRMGSVSGVACVSDQ